MKRIMILITLCCFAVHGRSQVWVDQGAVWHYDFVNVGCWGFYKYEYVHDTLILGKNCQQIKGSVYIFTEDQNNNTVLLSQQNLITNYTYLSGDTVFYYSNNKFQIMLNFGAVPGDRWAIALGADPYGVCNDTSYIVVHDTGKITINSTAYRYIKIQPTPDSPIGFTGTFVERFGNIDSSFAAFQLLFPGIYPCDTNYYAGTEWNRFKFRCFQDNSFSLLNSSNLDCEYDLTHLGIPEKSFPKFRSYPNPTSGLVNIEGNYKGEIMTDIYNCQGMLVRSLRLSSTPAQINLTDLPGGIYLLRMQNEGKEISLIRIIRL